MSDENTERARFEAWGNQTFNYGFRPESWGEKDPGEYAHEGTQMAFEGWLAAATPEPVAVLTDEAIAKWVEGFIKKNAYNYPVACQIAVEAAKFVRRSYEAALAARAGAVAGVPE